MNQLKEALALYRIYRYCNPPIQSLRLAIETLRTTR